MGLTRTSATPYKLMELAGQLEPHRLVGKATQVVVLKCFHGCWKNLSDLKIFKLVIIVTGAESCDNIRQSFSRWNDDHRTNSPSPSLKMGSSYLLFFVLIFQITSSYLSPPLSLPLICKHTYTHTRTHMLTLSCSHSRSLALTLSLSLSLSLTHTHTHTTLTPSLLFLLIRVKCRIRYEPGPSQFTHPLHFIHNLFSCCCCSGNSSGRNKSSQWSRSRPGSIAQLAQVSKNYNGQKQYITVIVKIPWLTIKQLDLWIIC